MFEWSHKPSIAHVLDLERFFLSILVVNIFQIFYLISDSRTAAKFDLDVCFESVTIEQIWSEATSRFKHPVPVS